MKRLLLTAVSYILILTSTATAQNLLGYVAADDMSHWVDSVMNKLSDDEKLGQLIMPLYYMPDYNQANRAIIDKEIKQYHLGGILFSKGTRQSQHDFVDYAQKQSRQANGLPLLIAADAEWGLAMRLKDGLRFPKNAELATIDPAVRDSLMYQYGLAMAQECRDMGIHVSFAPVLDVNSNPKNPVIGTRSFGADPEVVISCGLSYAAGLEDGGVMAVAKHFPGHGDTDQDSHKTLPLLKHDVNRMRTFEMKPFEYYSHAGFGGIMTAHLEVPSLEPTKGMPATASKNILGGELRQRIGFHGLVFTDGLAMEGARKYPDICVKALNAGVDILLQPTPIEDCWKSLKDAIKKGTLKRKDIDAKCRRVLQWKYALIVASERNRLAYPISLPVVSPQETSASLYAWVKQGDAKNATLLANHQIDPTEANATLAAQNTVVAPKITIKKVPAPKVHNPKEVGMNAKVLDQIDVLAQDAIAKGATPGCQILVARKGKVVYNKCFGTIAPAGADPRLEPYSVVPVNHETLYDLASISKAAATVPAVMLAIKEYDLSLKDRVTKWLPELKGSPYANVTLQDLLYHESGLRDGYHFYKDYAQPSLQLRDEEMINIIAGLKPKKKQGQYLYSCLNFTLLRYIIERLSGQRLDAYLQQRLGTFFNDQFCFNPLERGIDRCQIAPTEIDTIAKRQLVHGTVHDELCAWSLGVDGNAGLFGSATALARMLFMISNDGSEDGKRYIDKQTCHQFTTLRSSHSRRGLGFDRQVAKGTLNPSMTEECSPQTWGHTGFTGTCFWVDPKYDLVYIFLSNRICPSRGNNLLSKENYRTRIQSLVYQSLQ